jgi:hypothetical protein
MKHTRLLEIIREEISSALGEAATTYAGKTAVDDLKKDKAFSSLTGDAKADALEKLGSGGTVTIGEEKRKKLAEKYQLDEETINEMASIKQLKTQLEKQGKDKELQAIKNTEKTVLDTFKKDPTITSDGRLKGYVSAFKKELKSSHGVELQDLLTKVMLSAEKAGDKFKDDIATNTIEKDAAAQITGKEAGQRGRKADPNKPEKAPSTGQRGRPAGTAKEKIATRTTGDDGFDKVEYSDKEDEEGPSAKDIAGDETAKELGNTPEDKKQKFNLGLKFINKYKDDKSKIDAYLKKAKDEYKFTKNMLDDLKRAAGREVGA